MPRRLPPSHWLQAFEAAARHRGFARAAAELHVTQSAVSQRVRLLEDYLGTPLFHRLSRSVRLTDAGGAYLPLVSETFERLAQGTNELFDCPGGRYLKVKVNASFAALWLAPRLARFRARHPDIDLTFTHALWAIEEELDSVHLEIRYGGGHWPGFRVERLTSETRFPVCAPRLAEAPDGLREPSDLSAQTLIDIIGNDVDWAHWIKLTGADVAIVHRLQLEMSFIAYELAAAGAGVVLAHRSLTDGWLRCGRLRAPFNVEVPTAEGFFLVSPNPLPKHVGAIEFRNWLLTETDAWR